MNKHKHLKLSLYITNIFIIILAVFTVALPWMVTWYVETMGRSASLASTIMVTCYPCVPFAVGALVFLRKLLKNLIVKIDFGSGNLKLLRNLAYCCIVISAITLIAGKFYLPFFIVGSTFAFVSLLIFTFRSIFAEETENAVNNNGK